MPAQAQGTKAPHPRRPRRLSHAQEHPFLEGPVEVLDAFVEECTPERRIAAYYTLKSAFAARTPLPASCPLTLVGCMMVLSKYLLDCGPSKSKDDANMFHLMVEEINTLQIAWAVRPRTTAELEECALWRCTCHPSTADPYEFHACGDYFFKTDQDQQIIVFVTLCLIPLRLLDERYHDRSMKNRFIKSKMRRRWPHSLADVMPDGAENAFRGLVAWFGFDFGSSRHERAELLVAVTVLYELAPSSTMPYLVGSKTLLTGGIINSVHHASAKWEKHAFRSADKQHTQLVLKRTFYLLSSVCLVLSTLLIHAHQVQVNAFLAHVKPMDLLYCCNQATKLLDQLRIEAKAYATDTFKLAPAKVDALVPTFREVRHMICDHLPMDVSVITPISPAAAEHNMSEKRRLIKDFSHVAPEMASRQLCNAPGCTRTFADSGRRFRYCAGCLRVCYCSRACQKAAWNHEVGHRGVCSAIRIATIHRQKWRDAKVPASVPWTPEVAQAYKDVLAHRHALVSLEMSLSREFKLSSVSACRLTFHDSVYVGRRVEGTD
jgi:hypothetical protein